MKKTLIVLVAALALLGVILFKRGSDRKAMGEDVPALDSARKADVQTLRIAKAPDTSRIVRKDGGWAVGPEAWPGDTAKLNRALGHLFGLQAKEVVSKNPERLKEYGLDSAEAKHVALLDGAGKPIAEVVIGKTSGADYSSTYWKWEGKPEVYRTPGNFSYEIGTKADEWKDRKLFGFARKDIKFLEADWRDTGKAAAAYAWKLESVTDSTWKMLAPSDSNRVANGLANDAATRFADMSVDEFVAAGDTNLAKAQADSITLKVKVTLKDGKSFELAAGKAFDNYHYVKHPTRSETIKLSAWRFENFKKKPFELLEAPPPPKDTTAAAASTPAPAAGAAPKAADPHAGHGH